MARARRSRRLRARRTRASRRAGRAPRRASARAPASTRRGRAPARRRGSSSGPSTLNTVRVASSRRTGAAWRIAGWCACAKRKPKPSSSIDRSIFSGGSSSRKPSASSTSAEPVCDDAERLPCFATAAPAAAVDEGRRGRDVVRVRAVASRADDVDEVGARRTHAHDVLAHRLGATRDLVRRLALCAQRDEEAGDLGLRRLAGHDLAHRRAGVVAREVVTVQQARDDLLDHSFLSIRVSAPSGVRWLSARVNRRAAS